MICVITVAAMIADYVNLIKYKNKNDGEQAITLLLFCRYSTVGSAIDL